MPQLTPVVTNDGTSTKTFAPRGVDANNVTSFVVSNGVPLGDHRLTVQRTRTTQGREKVSIKMTIPVVATETVNGVAQPKITRTAYADLVLSFDGASSTAERLAVRSMISTLLDDESIADVVDNLETFY